MTDSAALLAPIEWRLRSLLPAPLYASTWIQPSSEHLTRVFHHLRTLQYILSDYVPRSVARHPPIPGQTRSHWQEGTLLFTDLAGFTALMEAHAIAGQDGAERLLTILNRYFSTMLEIVSKSGGDLLEFTGDALLVQFLATHGQNDTAQAVRAGLRMQRAMAAFEAIETGQGVYPLHMRVGIYAGRFLTADIGTPVRIAHVLLGKTVQLAKQAEGCGEVGRVCGTKTAIARLDNQFHWETLDADHGLILDDLTDDELGEYDISLSKRRASNPLLFDRTPEGIVADIATTLDRVEPLASYLPAPILGLLVDHAAQRQIQPSVPKVAVMFINLMGLAEAVDAAIADDVQQMTTCFSQLFALIHAAIQSQGGILQKVTYQSIGSDMLVYFGVMSPRSDDALRAVSTALAIQEIVETLPLPATQTAIALRYRIGIALGQVFAAEVGEPRGRREFNILGDVVNIASRLTSAALPNQILFTDSVYHQVSSTIHCTSMGHISLKGKAQSTAIYAVSNTSSQF